MPRAKRENVAHSGMQRLRVGPIVWLEGTDGIRGVQSVESGDLDASALPVVQHLKRVILIRLRKKTISVSACSKIKLPRIDRSMLCNNIKR